MKRKTIEVQNPNKTTFDILPSRTKPKQTLLPLRTMGLSLAMISVLATSEANAQSFNSISSALDFDLPSSSANEPEAEEEVEDREGGEFFEQLKEFEEQLKELEESGVLDPQLTGQIASIMSDPGPGEGEEAEEEEEEEPEEPNRFGLRLILNSGVDLDTNRQRAEIGTDDAARFRNQVTAAGQYAGDNITLSSVNVLRFDDYSGSGENDVTLLASVNRATFTGGSLKPYVGYTPVFLYSGFFGDHIVTIHNLEAGLLTSIELGKGKLTLEGNYTRRATSSDDFEQHRPFVQATFESDLGDDFKLSASTKLQPIYYTGGANDGREDFVITTEAKVTKNFTKHWGLQFGIKYENNDSNQIDSSYTYWEIGPKLVFTQDF